MKKIVQTADLGGAPFFKNDMRDVFNLELWDVIEGFLASFDGDTQGLIISGCVISDNAGNFNMTAGVVYLNGEFMRISAVTNAPFTKYIAPATPSEDSRTYADGTTKGLVENKFAELVSLAPGSGQYITISDLTISESRRFRPVVDTSSSVRWKKIDITNWNMSTNVNKIIGHGLDYNKIRSWHALIISDSGIKMPLNVLSPSGGNQGGPGQLTSISVELIRLTGGVFDDADYSGTGLRGYCYIEYEA